MIHYDYDPVGDLIKTAGPDIFWKKRVSFKVLLKAPTFRGYEAGISKLKSTCSKIALNLLRLLRNLFLKWMLFWGTFESLPFQSHLKVMLPWGNMNWTAVKKLLFIANKEYWELYHINEASKPLELHIKQCRNELYTT